MVCPACVALRLAMVVRVRSVRRARENCWGIRAVGGGVTSDLRGVRVPRSASNRWWLIPWGTSLRGGLDFYFTGAACKILVVAGSLRWLIECRFTALVLLFCENPL